MKRILTTLCMLLLIAGTSFAQTQPKQGGKKGNATEQRARHMAVSLELDESQTEWFVPLYVSYTDSLQALGRELYAKPLKANPTEEELQKSQKKRRQPVDLNKLNDEEAQVLIQRNFELQAKSLQLRQAYYQIFSARIAPKKLLPLFVQSGNGGIRTGNQRQGPPASMGFQGGGAF